MRQVLTPRKPKNGVATMSDCYENNKGMLAAIHVGVLKREKENVV